MRKLQKLQNVAVEIERTEDSATDEEKEETKKNKKEKNQMLKYEDSAHCSIDDSRIDAKSAISSKIQHTDSDSSLEISKESSSYTSSDDEIERLAGIERKVTKDANAGNKRALFCHKSQKRKLTRGQMQDIPQEVQDSSKENRTVSVQTKKCMGLRVSIPIRYIYSSSDEDNNDGV